MMRRLLSRCIRLKVLRTRAGAARPVQRTVVSTRNISNDRRSIPCFISSNATRRLERKQLRASPLGLIMQRWQSPPANAWRAFSASSYADEEGGAGDPVTGSEAADELLTKFQSVNGPEVRRRVFKQLFKTHILTLAEYVMLMYTAHSKGEFKLVIEMFDASQRDTRSRKPVIPNVFMINTLIDAYGRVGNFDKAEAAFDEMEDLGIDRDINTYNALVIALSKSSDRRHCLRAMSVFAEIDESGLEPDINSYHGALQACRALGLWKQAMGILEEIEDSDKLVSDTTALNLALGACSRGPPQDGKLRATAASDLFERMGQRGIVRDEVAYEALIISLEAGGKYNSAIDHFNGMLKKNLTWTTPIYNAILRALPKMGLLDAGRDTYYKMADTGLERDAGTFAAFFRSCRRQGELPMAEEEWEDAIKSGIEPTTDMYEQIIRSCAGSFNAEKALEYFAELELSSQPVTTGVYEAVIEAASKGKDVRSALELFNELIVSAPASGDTKPRVPLSTSLFNEAILAAARGSELELAESYLVEMKRRGIATDMETYNGMIRAAGNSGSPKRAIELFDYSLNAGMKHDHKTISFMIEALEGTEYGDDMFEVFKMITKRGMDQKDSFQSILDEQKQESGTGAKTTGGETTGAEEQR